MRGLHRAAWLRWVAVVVLGFAAQSASAWVPPADRVAGVVAEQNRLAQRNTRLRLAVVVKDPTGAPVARGEAELDPSGRARLELEYPDGRRELHERRGAATRVRTLDDEAGAASSTPTPASSALLLPFGLLQAGAPGQLLVALRELGGDPTRVDLGLERGRDCWVLGGRPLGDFDAPNGSAFWIDLEDKTPARIDVGADSRYRLGPPVRFGAVQLPSWYQVESPGQPVRRVEIEALATPNP